MTSELNNDKSCGIFLGYSSQKLPKGLSAQGSWCMWSGPTKEILQSKLLKPLMLAMTERSQNICRSARIPMHWASEPDHGATHVAELVHWIKFSCPCTTYLDIVAHHQGNSLIEVASFSRIFHSATQQKWFRNGLRYMTKNSRCWLDLVRKVSRCQSNL